MVVIVDLPEQPRASPSQRAEVVIAMRVIIGGERSETTNGGEDCRQGLLFEGDDASGRAQRAAASTAAQLVVEGGNGGGTIVG